MLCTLRAYVCMAEPSFFHGLRGLDGREIVKIRNYFVSTSPQYVQRFWVRHRFFSTQGIC